MKRASLLLLVLAACGGGGNEGPPQRPQGPAVSESTLGVFAEDLDAVLEDALSGALQQPVEGRRSAETVLRGRTGTVRVASVRLEEHAPARRDVAMAFDDYSVSDRLFLTGRVRWHELESGPAIVRGELKLAGKHGGRVRVHEQLQARARVGLSVDVEGAQLLLGQTPETLVTWVSTIAGDGTEGEEDGPIATARFLEPSGVAVADDGTIYVADRKASSVRVIAGGEVTTLTKDVFEPYDVGLDGEDWLVVANDSSIHDDEAVLVRVGLQGLARGIVVPIIGAFSEGCNAGVGSCDGRSPMASMPWIRGLDVQPGLITVAQWALNPSVRAVTPDGYVMTLRQTPGGCGEDALPGPRDVVMGPHGEVWVAVEHAIRVIDGEHDVRTLSGKVCSLGDDLEQLGPPDVTRFTYPRGLAYDGEHHVYVVHAEAIVRVDTLTGFSEPVAGCYSHEEGYDCTDDFGFRDGLGKDAQFDYPEKIALDPHGDLVVTDRDNHAVRLVRILFDPALDPVVARVDPPTLPRGASTTVTLWGANLATTHGVDLGPGIEVEILESWNRAVRLKVKVARDAELGARAPRVDTVIGSVTTQEGTALEVILAPDEPQVETIAGTGEKALDHVPFGASTFSTFGFATGLHAISAGKLLVADPVEHRIRMIGTRKEAAQEIFRALSAAFGNEQGFAYVTGVLGLTADVLKQFGISDAWQERAEGRLLTGVENLLTETCKDQGAAGCEWVSLPWAGVAGVSGKADGQRLTATFKLPSDVAGSGELFYVADAGNKLLRLIGRDAMDMPKAGEVTSPARTDRHPFAVAMASGGGEAFLTIPGSSAIAKFTLKGKMYEEPFLGGEAPRCGLFGGNPLGIPLGITRQGADWIVADPACRTLRRFGSDSLEIADLRGDLHSFGLGLCADGPLVLAALGAPMDVAALGDVIYVADAACHSIRAVVDLLGGLDADELKGYMKVLVSGQADRLGDTQTNMILARIDEADTTFLDSLRWWVVTIAGSPSGEPGYADGSGAESRFRFPTSLAALEEDGKRWLFVADTGNHRIRRIRLP